MTHSPLPWLTDEEPEAQKAEVTGPWSHSARERTRLRSPVPGHTAPGRGRGSPHDGPSNEERQSIRALSSPRRHGPPCGRGLRTARRDHKSFLQRNEPLITTLPQTGTAHGPSGDWELDREPLGELEVIGQCRPVSTPGSFVQPSLSTCCGLAEYWGHGGQLRHSPRPQGRGSASHEERWEAKAALGETPPREDQAVPRRRADWAPSGLRRNCYRRPTAPTHVPDVHGRSLGPSAQ